MNKVMLKLLEEADEAKGNAVSVFSNFSVGAAVITKKGDIYRGCNVENFSFSLSICAERVALLNAISYGERDFSAIAVVSSAGEFCFPCGSCRQLLWEFAHDIDVILRNNLQEIKSVNIRELLPMPFDTAFLEAKR